MTPQSPSATRSDSPPARALAHVPFTPALNTSSNAVGSEKASQCALGAARVFTYGGQRVEERPTPRTPVVARRVGGLRGQRGSRGRPARSSSTQVPDTREADQDCCGAVLLGSKVHGKFMPGHSQSTARLRVQPANKRRWYVGYRRWFMGFVGTQAHLIRATEGSTLTCHTVAM